MKKLFALLLSLLMVFTFTACEEEEVESIVAMLRETIPARRIVVGYIGPIIGASIGPDAVAIFGFGKPVTFNQGE